MADWYEELFDDRYLAFFEDALRQGAPAEEIEFVDRALALEPGARILDLGCGFGRHALPLAERGYRVTGLDLSERMLEVAGQIGARLGAKVEWTRRDMRPVV